jgi:hypothetical protein
MTPILEKARRLDIATHPAPNSLFEALTAGFNIWCTPNDHPPGWEDIKMLAGAFAQPCEYIGTATWGWTDERITHVELETAAYALRDRDRAAANKERQDYLNRPDDVAWAASKITWLFSLAGIECPPIHVANSNDGSN